MYKFVVVQGKGYSAYDVGKAEETSNSMARQGYELIEAYQSTVPAGCCGNTSKSVLVLVFKKVA